MKKNIEEFPGYLVDENGIVYGKRSGKPLSQMVNSGGRIRVSLNKNGKQYKRAVSRLVAVAFIPNPENKPQVDHIDGNRSNNNVSNLRWCTNEENQAYREEQGIIGSSRRGKRIIWGNEEFDSIATLAQHISTMRGSKFNTVRKEIQRARYGVSKLYGQELRYL